MKLKVISTSFADPASIAREIIARKLSPECSLNPSDEETIRCALIELAFPQVSNKVHMCLNYRSIYNVYIASDQLDKYLIDSGLDLSRLVELYSYCGSATYQLGPHSDEILIVEDNVEKLLSTIRNIKIMLQEGILKSTTNVYLVERKPNMMTDLDLFTYVKAFRPSVIFCSIPWGKYIQTRKIEVVFEGKGYTPYELAKKLLPMSPVVFVLPLPTLYYPTFKVQPIVIKRDSRSVYSLYILKTPQDLDDALVPVNRSFVQLLPSISVESSILSSLEDCEQKIDQYSLVPAPSNLHFKERLGALEMAFNLPLELTKTLAIDYNSVRLVNRVSDNLLAHFSDIDLHKVYDLCSGIGDTAFMLASHGSSIWCHEQDVNRYFCLVHNMIALRKAGHILSKTEVKLSNSYPDLLSNALDEYGTTVIMATIPWDNFLLTGKIEVRYGDACYTPMDIAKIALKRERSIPIVFQLPGADKYTPRFLVPPVNIYRTQSDGEDYLAYSLYILRSLSDIEAYAEIVD